MRIRLQHAVAYAVYAGQCAAGLVSVWSQDPKRFAPLALSHKTRYDSSTAVRGGKVSGDEGNLGIKPGGVVALDQRPYGKAEHQPGVDAEQQGREQAELGAVGSGSRLIHRLGILTLLAGMSAVLVAWVVSLVWGAVWVWHQLPLV